MPRLFDEISKHTLEEFIKGIDGSFVAVEPVAVDLLKHLLTHHEQRYSADQALQHPYFEDII